MTSYSLTFHCPRVVYQVLSIQAVRVKIISFAMSCDNIVLDETREGQMLTLLKELGSFMLVSIDVACLVVKTAHLGFSCRFIRPDGTVWFYVEQLERHEFVRLEEAVTHCLKQQEQQTGLTLKPVYNRCLSLEYLCLVQVKRHFPTVTAEDIPASLVQKVQLHNGYF